MDVPSFKICGYIAIVAGIVIEILYAILGAFGII